MLKPTAAHLLSRTGRGCIYTLIPCKEAQIAQTTTKIKEPTQIVMYAGQRIESGCEWRANEIVVNRARQSELLKRSALRITPRRPEYDARVSNKGSSISCDFIYQYPRPLLESSRDFGEEFEYFVRSSP